MAGFIIRRILWTIPVVLLCTLITFTLVKQLPNEPFRNNPKLTEAAAANLERIYGLDQPVWRQYLNYIGDLAQGDLGRSIRPGGPEIKEIVFGTDILSGPLATSMTLGFYAFWLALFVGTFVGVISALKVNTRIDHTLLFVSTIAFAVPLFIVATYWVAYLPYDWDIGWERIGPISVLALGIMPYFTRLVRAAMLETLQAEFVVAARSKGLPWRRTVVRHVLRNSLIPMVTNAGPLFGFVITGSFLIELIMAVPGVAYQFVKAFQGTPDSYLALNITVLFAVIIVIVNLVVDILVTFLDPRIVND